MHQKATFLLNGLVLALLCNTVVSRSSNCTGTPLNQTSGGRNLQLDTEFGVLLLAAVNKERVSRGLSPLCMNMKLQSAAQKHSKDMASNNFMSHTGSNGSSMSKRVSAAGFKWTAVAENVAAGQIDVMAVMKAWMNSAGHRKNILSRKFNMLGCGYAYKARTNLKHFWTQNFGSGQLERCSL
ncbi:hypothetical protein CCR75_000466 [Bremia lactucae]|uniref:SCP domain-containing protein n=1 Tax=Bremia lactucae TaxID=4779 RepID=A0A976FL94_BRELC|nr:hypothetical protein CCR75_000466 [Bremia lactucae]